MDARNCLLKEESEGMEIFPVGGTSPDKRQTQGDTMQSASQGRSPRRLMEVRIRVASGYYDHPAVLIAAAEKMLEKGDIGPWG